MAMETAIQGLGQLTDVFQGIAGRNKQTELQESSQEFQKGERLGTEEFTASESALERAFKAKEGAANRALPWAQFNKAQEELERQREYAKESASIYKSDITSQTTEGKAGILGLEKGAISPAQYAAMQPKGVEGQMALHKLVAQHPDDPNIVNAGNIALKANEAAQSEQLYLENYAKERYKHINGDGTSTGTSKKKTSFDYDPGPLIPAIKQIAKDYAGYDLSEEPLFSHLAELPESTRAQIRDLMINKMSEVVATQDSRFQGGTITDPVTKKSLILPNEYAKDVAVSLYTRLSTGGAYGLLKGEKLDVEGNWGGFDVAAGAYLLTIDTTPSDAFKYGFFEEPHVKQYQVQGKNEQPKKVEKPALDAVTAINALVSTSDVSTKKDQDNFMRRFSSIWSESKVGKGTKIAYDIAKNLPNFVPPTWIAKELGVDLNKK